MNERIRSTACRSIAVGGDARRRRLQETNPCVFPAGRPGGTNGPYADDAVRLFKETMALGTLMSLGVYDDGLAAAGGNDSLPQTALTLGWEPGTDS